MNLFDKIMWPLGILLCIMFTGLMAYNLSWLVPVLNNYEHFEKDYLNVTLVVRIREDSNAESGANYEYIIHGNQDSNGRRISARY